MTVGQLRARWLTAEMIERLAAGDERYRKELQAVAQGPDDYRPFTHPACWAAFICQGDPAPLAWRARREA